MGGQIKKEKRTVNRCTGNRREDPKKKKVFEYEVNWVGKSMDANTWHKADDLLKWSKVYEKVIRMIDAKIAARESMFARPLTQQNVEQHLADTGLEPEYGTHFRINSLSGGQKVKVVLAAAMWDQPHILILDEPTNYLDRDSLGALAEAIETFDGGVVIISHNNEFCSKLCPETWVMDAGHLETKGDAEWMLKQDTKIDDQQQLTEVTDAAGNVTKLKGQKKKLSKKEEKQMVKKLKAKIKNGEALDSDEEEFAIDKDLI